MICIDKFLVQSTVVTAETTDEDITSTLFAKGDGRYVEENRLKVILVNPPNSPVLSLIKGTFKQVLAYEVSQLKDQILRKVESLIQSHSAPEDIEDSKMEKSEVRPAKDVEYKTMKDVEEPATDIEHKQTKDAEEPVKHVEHETMMMRGAELGKEEMKSKLRELKVKLSQAEVTISKLTEEGRSTAQERESIQQELGQYALCNGLLLHVHHVSDYTYSLIVLSSFKDVFRSILGAA
ncbi:hypothetical protein Acr_07g0008160 [Actinidia rufa]|uniref:Uncharacterized protein n=1 Tax=Actinidia rufa TaxID=165716 RepID=A0A7J0EXF1_9ERIC|nr:hypothetical protein Acr_07g0008160 [Actinidia rufa]